MLRRVPFMIGMAALSLPARAQQQEANAIYLAGPNCPDESAFWTEVGAHRQNSEAPESLGIRVEVSELGAGRKRGSPSSTTAASPLRASSRDRTAERQPQRPRWWWRLRWMRTCVVGPNHFRIQCGGPAGLPLRCNCTVNSQSVGDLDWDVGTFYASACRDAATRIANGEWCTNRLDCCLKYVENGEEKCRCGSERGCDDLARYNGATYVDTCPQYEP